MIINGNMLLEASPIKDMLDHKVQAEPTSYGLTECGYDIRIKQNIYFLPKTCQRISHPVDQVRISHPQEMDRQEYGLFCLASSIEEFDMPNHLMGQVLNKSTWARLGLDASMTTNIEPGWKGFLTLELTYHGQNELIIPAGSGIAQVMFHEIAEHRTYKGKYQNQADEPVAPRIIMDQHDPNKRGFTPK